MRNLRKLTAVVIAVALVLTSMTAAFAASGSYEFEDQATVLKDLGIWQGNTAGDLMLGEKLTRAQGAVLVLKTVLGKTDKDMEAADVSAIAKYTDASEVPAWAEGWVALAVKEGVMKGGNNKLAAGAELKGKDLASMFMNALGFAAENEYATAVEKLAAKSAGKILAGIADDITDADLTRDAASAVVFDTLTVKAKDAAKTVVEVLVGTDAAKKAVAEKAGLIVAPAAQAVTDVKALNLKQVQITFAKDLVKADAEKISNYAVTEGTTDKATSGGAVLQADGKSVVVTLGQEVTNGKTAIVEVKNFATYKSDAVKFEDSTVPTVVGVTVSGPNTLTVEYSEPIKHFTGESNTVASEFKVDGGNYIPMSAKIDSIAAPNKVIVKVGVNFTEGTHKIAFEGKEISDFANYKVLPRTIDFTVTNDKTAPVITLKSADPKQIVLASNKPLDKNFIDSNVRFSHTYNSPDYAVFGAAAEVTLNDAGTEITLNFSAKVIPLGANNIYISYVDAAKTQLQDLWGNKLPATVIPVSISLDTTKPTVSEVKFDNASQLTVVFSEKLAALDSNASFTVKDSTGKAITVTPALLTGDDANKVTLTTEKNALGGGTYTIEIKGVKDQAFVNNTMEPYSATLNFTDKVNPSVKSDSATIAVTNGSDGKTNSKASIYIPFSEQMDATTLVKANFMKDVGDGKFIALQDNDTVTAAADGKSVTIVLDKYAAGFDISKVKVMVGIVKDVAGNGLMTYTETVAPKTDAIAVKTVEATAKKQLKVTFTGRLSAITPTGILLSKSPTATTTDVSLSIATNTVNSDGVSEVTLNLGNELNEDATFGVASDKMYLVIKGATDTKSYLGAVISENNTALTDKIAPTIKSVIWKSATSIEITFNEKLEADTFAKTLNGFSVTGGDAKLTKVELASGADDGAVIVLTGEKFVVNSTVVKYNSAAGITDTATADGKPAGNKVADFEKTAADK